MLAIAAPVVAAMTSYTLMQFVDKLMVSRIGPDPVYVGAQGNGGLCAFVPIAIAMGLLTVVNTYVAQHLGAKTPERGPAYAWAGLWISAVYWAVFLVPYAFALPHVLGLIRALGGETDPGRLAEMVRRDDLAAHYGQILVFGAVITMSSRAIQQYFYGMHRTTVVMVATIAGNVANLALNTLLVFGPTPPAPTETALIDAWFEHAARLAAALHIPAMGVPGSALGTVLATVLELAIPMAVFLSPSYQRLYGTLRAFRPGWGPVRDLLRLGWPGAAMFGNEMTCWAIFMVGQVGRFGPEHSTAGWIAHQYMSLSFMPTVGISIAITAMVGKCMGAGRPDLARQRAWLGLRVAMGYMALCGLAFVLFRERLVDLFIERGTPATTRELLVHVGSRFLIATAAFQLFDAVAMSLSGALRGAGDTRWPGVATLILSWSIIVAGGWLMVRLAPGLGSLGPWITAAGYIVVLSLALLARFLHGGWTRIRLVEGATPAAGH
jgi:MATE family multidrug resistance protein